VDEVRRSLLDADVVRRRTVVGGAATLGWTRLSPSGESAPRRGDNDPRRVRRCGANAVADLRRLPGVGEYTANAVASFAFGECVAVVDTNVGRVLARAVANRTLSVRDARVVANELLPRSNAAAFNQALLDLGAQFCTSTPRCDPCPMARVCRWHVEGGPDPAPRSAGVSRPQSKFQGSDRQARVESSPRCGSAPTRCDTSWRALTTLTYVGARR